MFDIIFEHHLVMRILQLFFFFEGGDAVRPPPPIFWAQTNYPLAWMFFFCTLATAFPTSYCMKTVCSCWVWKLSNDACPLNLVPSASFLTQSDWLEKKADQSLCVGKEALGTRLMSTKTVVKCVNAFRSVLHF